MFGGFDLQGFFWLFVQVFVLFFEGGCLDQDSQTVSLNTNLNFKTQPKIHGQSDAIDLNHF